MLADWWLPPDVPSEIRNGLGWPSILFPNSLAFPLSFVLRLSGSAMGFALTIVFALATLACWLEVRRRMTERIGALRFLVIMILWPTLSFGLDALLMLGGAYINRIAHSG